MDFSQDEERSPIQLESQGIMQRACVRACVRTCIWEGSVWRGKKDAERECVLLAKYKKHKANI